MRTQARWFVLIMLTLAVSSASLARESAIASRYMIAAAHPLAAQAGLAMLRGGGSAVDAAIAAQMVLTLVEPQSSGIGGGAFLLHFDAARQDVRAYDGRETAPATATSALFLGADGEPLEFDDAVVSGRSVGAPGAVAMLALAHRQHGKLPWAALVQPAISLAERGFPISSRLAAQLAREPYLKQQAAARAYFYGESGEPPAAGTFLRNAELADTLRAIAADPQALYRGPIAQDIVATVQAGAGPGGLSVADLAAYQAKQREPLCRDYRQWEICGMPPPSSGGIAVLQILGILEQFDIEDLRPDGSGFAHLFIEASKLAFADRNQYVADSDFVRVPIDAMLDGRYLAERARLIDLTRAMPRAEAGELPARRGDLAPGFSFELPSTSHLSVVDAEGNAVSMTTSIESAFGSRLFVRGFLLNNQLTDFSFQPAQDGRDVANRVQPGKRPRSSMSPTLVFDREGKLLLSVGSPGGSRIIGYVAKTLVAALDFGLDIQLAIDAPHIINRNGPTELEAGTAAAAMEGALGVLGHQVRIAPLTSGLQGIQVTPQGLRGGADPRREGVALGD